MQEERDALAAANAALEGEAAANSTAFAQELQDRNEQLAASDAARRELEDVAAELQAAKAAQQGELARLEQANSECASGIFVSV